MKNTWDWNSCLAKYEDKLEGDRKMPTSIKSRLIVLRNLQKYAEKNKVVPSNVSKVFARQFFITRKLKSSTWASQRSYLYSFFEFLQENNIVEQNPIDGVASVKINTQERIVLNDSELEKIYTVIHTQNKNSIRDLIIFNLLMLPALRVKELAELKIGDLFLENQTIKVLRKGGNEAILPIKLSTVELIKKYLALRKDIDINQFLILSSVKNKQGSYNGLSIRAIQHVVKNVLMQTVDLNKMSYGPHLLRHTGATMIAANGDMPTLQKILGHSSIKTTQIYSHTNIERMNDAIQSISLPKKRATP